MRLPKIDLACGIDDLRPQFACISVGKESVEATDAHVIVRHITREIFKDEFIESLPDSGIMIPKRAFVEMRKSTTLKALLSEDKKRIILQRRDESEISYPLYFGNPFPDSKNLWKEKTECKALDKIAISSRLLSHIAESMGCESGILQMYFYHDHQAIMVYPNGDSDYFGARGMIMPVIMR